MVTIAFSRRAVYWAMSERPVADAAVKAVNTAKWNRRPGRGLIHQGNHGCQYTGLTFRCDTRQHGIVGPIGTVGDSLDNALVESLSVTLRTKLSP